MTTAAAEARTELRCPRCGARLAPDQDWCLECGAAASTRVVPPPSWKLAVAIVGGVIAVVAVAVVIALSSLSGDARRAASRHARAPRAAVETFTAPSATTPTATATTPASSTTPTTPTSTSATPAPGTSPRLATWPAGRIAWTVVLASAANRATAERRARELAANGIRAGVLDTSRYNLDSGGAAFVVFTGQYRDQGAAVAAENKLGGRAPTKVYVAEVSPR